MYVFMSRRQARVYQTVFENVNEMLANFNVEQIMTDFEKAIWRARCVSRCKNRRLRVPLVPCCFQENSKM